MFLAGCDTQQSTDRVERIETEKQMKEAYAQTGLPAITNFQEKKLMKMIYELRDREDLINYAYLYNEMTGQLVFLGRCVGYGLPYATQYSNPEKHGEWGGMPNMPQPEPNGLFMPESAQATWLMLVDPQTNEPRPVFVEPNLLISPFKLK
jgi:hypothetical protein